MKLALPDPLLALSDRLAEAGHRTWLVGECLHDLLATGRADTFALATSARADDIARCLQRAIPVRPGGVAFVVPSALGPIDLLPLRNGREVEADLAHRDFTLLGMALAPGDETLIDPHGGAADLEAGLLRAIGDPAARLAEDPVRVVRAARLVAQHGYAVDAALEAAITAHPPATLAAVPAMRLRAELLPLLLAPHVEAGLALLQRTDALGPFARPRADAAAVVARLPARLEIRLAAWLRGAGGGRAMRWLRIHPERSAAVHALLQLHPIEQTASPQRRVALRRLRGRLAPEQLDDLIGLRRAEIAHAIEQPGSAAEDWVATAGAALDRLLVELHEQDEATARERDRPRLAVDGRTLMQAFGWAAGPGIGRALRYLEARVNKDASLNEPARLLELLSTWSDSYPA